MGLTHPSDLDAWRRWHDARSPLRTTFRRLRGRRSAAPLLVDVLTGSDEPGLLVAVEATHASVVKAVAEPLRHRDPAEVAVVCPVGWDPPVGEWRRRTVEASHLASLLPSVGRVLAAGHYTPIGAAAYALARQRDLPFLVAQHGALTPFAPPLPPSAQLLAWSQEDADFWRSGRQDVAVEVVGSQLLWAAGGGFQDRELAPPPPTLVYLGQLHAAELSRVRLVRAATAFCREHHATYRPHPSERDLVSRLVQAGWERSGVHVDRSGQPLAELGSPVVSVFSTGVLEAAARGVDAWVDYPDPPAWLRDFWDRYGMSRFGAAPTPAPPRPSMEPAAAIAGLLKGMA